MLLQAMNKFQVSKRDYDEAKKAQYTDKGDVKNYFRASELGSSDRKIIYGFFKHQIPTIPRSAKNLRTLENGDKTHERYQKAWEDMGALISMEERVTSKDDDYLKDFPWEWAGHYDGLLDMNVLKAHAQGLCTVGYGPNDQGELELEIDVDEDYATEIGLFEEGYAPLAMVADIKTMNPWTFKKIKEKQDISGITGYIDQISFYMYMLNTPYGSIFIEDKGSNDTLEIQIVWEDMHEDVEYVFDPDIHGEVTPGIIRVTVNNDRFFGTETTEGLVTRLDRLWAAKQAIETADAENDEATLKELMPPRCCEDPSSFPCSWADGKEKCEFFEHCWNQFTGGCSIRAFEACPPELIWEITCNDTGCVVGVDSRKVPTGVTQEALQALVNMGAMNVDKLLVDDVTDIVPAGEAEDTAINSDNLFDANGELKIGNSNQGTPEQGQDNSTPGPSDQDPNKPTPPPAPDKKPTEAKEYAGPGGKKAIKCLNCGKEVTYQKLANGGTKKCPFCNNINKVIK